MKKFFAIIINTIIVYFGIAGVIMQIISAGTFAIQYYTNLSNVIGTFASLFFIIAIISPKKWIVKTTKILKLISVSSLAVTFITVAIILAPMDKEHGYFYYFIHGSMFNYHLVIPVLSFITFAFFERYDYKYINALIYNMIFTISYGILMAILSNTGVVKAPYPFLDFINSPIWFNVICFVVILGIDALITFILLILEKKNKEEILW